MGVSGLAVVEVYDINFLEDAPVLSVTIHLSDAVSREVSDFDLEEVLSWV